MLLSALCPVVVGTKLKLQARVPLPAEWVWEGLQGRELEALTLVNPHAGSVLRARVSGNVE